MWLLIHDIERCIGCGACVAVDPEHWELKGDKARLKRGKISGSKAVLELKELGNAKEAVDACPVGAIKLEKA